MDSRPSSDARRPLLVELGAALLIAGGAVEALARLGAPPVDPLALAVDAVVVAVGLLVRAGRAWVLVLNAVAVLVFLEFRELVVAPNPFGALLAAADSLVFVALVRHRTWFERRLGPPPRETPSAPSEREVEPGNAPEEAGSVRAGRPYTGRPGSRAEHAPTRPPVVDGRDRPGREDAASGHEPDSPDAR